MPPCVWWQYGDGGVDIEPIGDLYKTQVRGLSRYMGVPLRIIEKTPTAGLWPGQTDESELGVSYEMADQILTMLVDEKKKISEVKSKFPPEIVDKLAARMKASEHKRIMPKCVMSEDRRDGYEREKNSEKQRTNAN